MILRVYTSACRNSLLCPKFWQEISARFLCQDFMPKYFKAKFCAKSFGTVPEFWLRISAQNFGMKLWAETFGTFFLAKILSQKFGILPKFLARINILACICIDPNWPRLNPLLNIIGSQRRLSSWRIGVVNWEKFALGRWFSVIFGEASLSRKIHFGKVAEILSWSIFESKFLAWKVAEMPSWNWMNQLQKLAEMFSLFFFASWNSESKFQLLAEIFWLGMEFPLVDVLTNKVKTICPIMPFRPSDV